MVTAVQAGSALSHGEQEFEQRLAGLIREIAAGNHEALGRLYDDTSRSVFSLAYRIVGEHAAAEEVTCDVFTYVWRQAQKYDPERSVPSAWLLMLARSRGIDSLRSRVRQGAGREQPLDTDFRDTAPDPEESANRSARRRRIQAALTSLPLEQREAIELAYFSGLSQSEISERTGVPLGTIKSRIRVGMARLRSLLESANEHAND